MLIIVPCSKSQYFQQTIFGCGLARNYAWSLSNWNNLFFYFAWQHMINSPHGTFACMGELMGGHISCYGLLFLLTRKKKHFFARYSTLVAKYGHSIRVRSNCATKHSLVQEDMECARLNVYKPYLIGSLVHN